MHHERAPTAGPDHFRNWQILLQKSVETYREARFRYGEAILGEVDP
jgi:hypothetical protein